MARAVATIPPVSEGEAKPTCASCFGELSDSALKCSNCKAYTHLSCSRVPKYMLIRFLNTQVSYFCQSCVKIKDLGGDEERYSNEMTKVEEIMAMESSLVSQVEQDANVTTDEIDETQAGGTNSGVPISSAPKNNNGADDTSTNTRPNCRSQSGSPAENGIGNTSTHTAVKKPVCKFFLRQKCQHGRKGTSCKFDHPKLCFKFIKNGDKRGGCSEGPNCSFVHPKLCNGYKSGVCKRTNCNFFHT